MGRLLIKFENEVLQEWPLSDWRVTIGRAPDNDIQIDNLAVSDHHARISTESGRLMIEDLGSLNGTFLNNTRVKREWLRSGDAILVGKHTILVDELHDPAPTLGAGRKSAAPKVAETEILGTKQRRELEQQAASAKGSSASSPDRARVPSLIVLRGKTSQKDYLLTSRLTIIGKSALATVQLRGWFAPEAAAQISKRYDGFYLGLTKRVPKINGQAISGPTRLEDGDLIDVAGVQLKFTYLN
jgi:pSer/pThr/pTyr-binding forkhead associated (FHA) protein